LWLKVLLLTLTVLLMLWSTPPSMSVKLSLKVLLLMFSVPSRLKITPPPPNRRRRPSR